MLGLFVAAPASHRGIGRIGGIRQRAPPRPRGCPRGAGHPLQRGRAGMEPLKGNLLLRRGLGLLPCSSPTPCPFLGCLPRHVEEVRRWTGSRAGPVALGIRVGLARVKRGRAGFQSVPPPPALGRSLVPSSFPPVHPNQVLPRSPRRAPARVRDTRWQCHTVVPLLTPHGWVAAGCSGASRPCCPS